MEKRHKHHHAGKSSRHVISASKVFDILNLPRKINFLDAGCGDGYFTIEAALRLSENSKIIAVDVHEESLKKLEKEIEERNIKNVEIIKADITQKLPLEDKSIDVYFIANVLHGFDRDESISAVKEAKRILKNGGKLVVIEFKKEPTPIGPPLEIRISSEELKDFLKDFHFESENFYEISPYNYLSVFKLKG